MFEAREIFHDMTAQFLDPPQADPGDTVEIRLRTGAADVISVVCISLVLSFLATLYPSWSASRTQPAEALRYE